MVQIQCKNCKRAADSSTFVIDPIIGKLVCPQCVKDRKTGKMSSTLNQQVSASQPQIQTQSSAPSKPQMSSAPSQTGAVKGQQPSTLADLTTMMLSKKSSSANSSGASQSKPAFSPFAKPTQVAQTQQAKPQMQTIAGQTKPQPIAPSKPKPNVPGWDADDDALERMAPKFDTRQVAPKLDANHVQLTCSKCQYKIKYDVVKEQPKACPYCGREVDTSEVRF